MQQTNAYRGTLKRLYSFTDYEKKGLAAYAPENYNLDRVYRLLALLGDPQDRFQCVHIAGTKGKGSTSAMIESVLRAAGYRTALYTSPHLHTFRERIQVNGEMIPEADVIRFFKEMQPLITQVPDITTFEVMTGLAFAWYAEQEVEWAVVEVGLGGRLDATNVVLPAVSVITSLSLDHTGILGETLPQIAAEKAGIIKPGVPVVSAPQADEALAVIEATCQQQKAALTVVGRDWIWEAGPANLDGQALTVRHRQDTMTDLRIPLLGAHQLENATTAVATLDRLREMGLRISDEIIREGLQAVRWPGRLEILGRAPLVVADCAHNGDSAEKLVIALKAHCQFERLIMIVGASTDHVTSELLDALLSEANQAIATKSQHPRAADPQWLQAQSGERGFHMVTAENVPQALERALEGATSTDLICFTGSVFVAAEARAAWMAHRNMPLPPVDPA